MKRSMDQNIDLVAKALRDPKTLTHLKLEYSQLLQKTRVAPSSLSKTLRIMVKEGTVAGSIEVRKGRLTPIYKLTTPVHWKHVKEEKGKKDDDLVTEFHAPIQTVDPIIALGQGTPTPSGYHVKPAKRIGLSRKIRVRGGKIQQRSVRRPWLSP